MYEFVFTKSETKQTLKNGNKKPKYFIWGKKKNRTSAKHHNAEKHDRYEKCKM